MRNKTDPLKRVRDGEKLNLKDEILLILRLSLPAILAQISSIIMQYIDASMVGRLGANASAAIGLVASTTWLVGGQISAVSTGFTVQVAHRIGAGDEKGARRITGYALLAGLCFSLALMLVTTLISPCLPRWMGGDEAIQRDASLYFLVYAISLPVRQLLYLSEGMIQSSGNIRLPSVLNVCMCGMDVLFNALLIPHLGVLGAALGTLMAEAVTMSLTMYFLLLRTPALRFLPAAGERGKRRKKGEGNLERQGGRGAELFWQQDLPRALRIGIPVGLENAIMGMAYVAFTRIVSPIGTVAVAANSFSITAESLCYMPGYGIGIAATTIVGQSLGAGRLKLSKRLGWIASFLGMLIMGGSGLLMYIFAPQMIGILTPDEDIRRLGVTVLRIEAFAEPLYGASIVASGVFRGAGETFVSTILNLISTWLVRIPMAAFLAPRYGLKGVWSAMCIELCVRGLLYLGRMAAWKPKSRQPEGSDKAKQGSAQ